MQFKLFGPIFDTLVATESRDNLLNSACLEFFDYIKRETVKPIICHMVENYRDRFHEITYVDIFSNFAARYDMSGGFSHSSETTYANTETDTQRSELSRMGRWENGIKDLDPNEEEYFNTSDDEDDAHRSIDLSATNGNFPSAKPLVDYTSDEENDVADVLVADAVRPATPDSSEVKDPATEVAVTPSSTASSLSSPPERLSEKRRREEDEDDEIGKLSHSKRRSSTNSVTSSNSSLLRRKKNFVAARDAAAGKTGKIAISLGPVIKTAVDGSRRGDADS